MEPIKCYTDASYDPTSHVAVIGWRIQNGLIHTTVLHNTNNTRAEIIGLIDLLDALTDKTLSYVVYTDCQSILNRLAVKDKLIEMNFCNNKGEPLHNSDLYKKLFNLLSENPNIKLTHIKGHLPTKDMTADNSLFSELDKCVRRKLRAYRNI